MTGQKRTHARLGYLLAVLLASLLGIAIIVSVTNTAVPTGMTSPAGSKRVLGYYPMYPMATDTSTPTNTPRPNPNTCALADHYFQPMTTYGNVTCDQPTQNCTGIVGSRVELDLMVHPPAGG